MKKNRKHQFTHPDPERIETVHEKKGSTKSPGAPKDEKSLTAKDLKRVLLTILIFFALLVGFYFVNLKTDLMQRFTELLGL